MAKLTMAAQLASSSSTRNNDEDESQSSSLSSSDAEITQRNLERMGKMLEESRADVEKRLEAVSRGLSGDYKVDTKKRKRRLAEASAASSITISKGGK